MFFDIETLFADEEVARKPQQARSSAKQDAIFRAAAALFAEKGYHGANTREIAERAGVSIGTLYFNFKDKRQILLRLLADQVGGYAGLSEVDPAAVRQDPLMYLAEQLRLAFPYNQVFYSISDAVRELAVRDGPFRNKLDLLAAAVYKRIWQIIEVGISAEMTHPTLSIDVTAQTVTALIFNFYAILPSPASVPEALYWQRHQTACEMICHAIFRDQFIVPSMGLKKNGTH
ncbi:MAG: TetR/AcrR family transcriptional regulator [Candidatus Promineifilaceae bacterium]